MGKICWADLSQLLRAPRKFSCEILAIGKQYTLVANASWNYFRKKLNRFETANV